MEQEKDIVERLRYLVEDETGAINRERSEAADEIERLRGRLERAQQQIGHLMAIRDAQAAVLGQERGTDEAKRLKAVEDKRQYDY